MPKLRKRAIQDSIGEGIVTDGAAGDQHAPLTTAQQTAIKVLTSCLLDADKQDRGVAADDVRPILAHIASFCGVGADGVKRVRRACPRHVTTPTALHRALKALEVECPSFRSRVHRLNDTTAASIQSSSGVSRRLSSSSSNSRGTGTGTGGTTVQELTYPLLAQALRKFRVGALKLLLALGLDPTLPASIPSLCMDDPMTLDFYTHKTLDQLLAFYKGQCDVEELREDASKLMHEVKKVISPAKSGAYASDAAAAATGTGQQQEEKEEDDEPEEKGDTGSYLRQEEAHSGVHD